MYMRRAKSTKLPTSRNRQRNYRIRVISSWLPISRYWQRFAENEKSFMRIADFAISAVKQLKWTILLITRVRQAPFET